MNIVPTIDADTAQTAEDGLWFKDAVIYQLHVKAFQDSNGDGVGDLDGIRRRLEARRRSRAGLWTQLQLEFLL